MAATHYKVSGEGPKLLATFSTFIGLTTVAIALRAYVRMRLIKKFGIEDWLSVGGWLAYVLLAATAMASTFHGFGQHAELIQPQSEIETALKLTWVSECLYAIANAVIKLSICLMLFRFVLEPSHKLLLYVVMSSTCVSSAIFFFVFIFQCSPVSFFWRQSQGDTEGKCLAPIILVIGTYIYSAISVFCDWSMAILPWILVHGIQMSFRDKVGVVFVLGMGSIASIAAIGRLAYVLQIRNTHDILYEMTGIAIWSSCETGLGLFASCAATLKPLIKSFHARYRRSKSLPRPNFLISLRPVKQSQPSSSDDFNSTSWSETQVRSCTVDEQDGNDHLQDTLAGIELESNRLSEEAGIPHR